MDQYEFGKSGSNKTNLLNPFASKRSTKAGYLTSQSAKKGGDNPKRGGDNIKNSVKASKSSNYLTPDAKKTFNHLRHVFTQALIFQYFDPE